MGLQLWLPLNGNIRNQGLCDVKIEGNPDSWENGKIGKCGLFNNNYLFMNNYSQNLFQPSHDKSISIACWVKCTGTGNVANSYILAWSAYEFFYSPNEIMFRLGDGNKNTYRVSGTINGDGWHHVVGIWDAKNKKVQIYFDGEFFKDITVSQSINFNSISSSITLPYRYIKNNLSINDFRLYDECLSPKQIKYISQAMICHYPMGNVDGKIGGRNLIRNSGKFLLGSSDFSIGQWRIAGNSTMVRSRVDITDPPECCKSVTGAYQAVGKHPPTLNDAECIGMDNFPYLSDCNIGDTCTFSAWARVVGGGENCYFGFSSYMTKSVKGDSYGYDKFINNYAVDALNPDGSWTHIVIHFKLTASLTNNIYVGFLTGDKNVTVQACAFKLEKGNIVTPYTPAPEDNSQFYDNIIPDISGYQNNATVKDSTCPAWSNDSPRYLGSYRFDGKSQYISGLSPISNDTKEFTISFWVKLNNVPDPMTFYTARKGIGIGVALFFINKNIRFDDNVQSTFNYTYDLSSNKWTHLCVTRNNTSKKLYVNGKLVDSTSKVGDMQNIGQHFTIGSSEGADNGIGTDNFLNGNISDFRIYATALSESDVLNLYQSSASLDSQGNLMLSGEVVE